MSTQIEHGIHCAIQNFLTKEECEGIALSGDITPVQDKINKAIFDWNDQDHTKFKVSYSDHYDSKVITHEDETSQDVGRIHSIHNENLSKKCAKIQAYIFLTDRDEYQGGEILTEGWQPVPYQDNFGKWMGDPDAPAQPIWLSEQGSLYITHAGTGVGFNLTHNGSAQLLRIIVGGPAYK